MRGKGESGNTTTGSPRKVLLIVLTDKRLVLRDRKYRGQEKPGPPPSKGTYVKRPKTGENSFRANQLPSDLLLALEVGGGGVGEGRNLKHSYTWN